MTFWLACVTYIPEFTGSLALIGLNTVLHRYIIMIWMCVCGFVWMCVSVRTLACSIIFVVLCLLSGVRAASGRGRGGV